MPKQKTINQKTIELLSNNSRLLNSLISLTENIQNMRLASVDLADFFELTGNSTNSYLLIDKYYWANKEDLITKLEFKNIPTDLKSVWVDMRFNDRNSCDCIDIYDSTYLKIKEQLGNSVEIINVDYESPKSNSVSIIGFN